MRVVASLESIYSVSRCTLVVMGNICAEFISATIQGIGYSIQKIRLPSIEEIFSAALIEPLHIMECKHGALTPASGRHIWIQGWRILCRYTLWDDEVHETLLIHFRGRRGESTIHFNDGRLTHWNNIRKDGLPPAYHRRLCENLLALIQQKTL